MARRRKNRPSHAVDTPFHGIGRVKMLVRDGKVDITDDALDDAEDSFGWKTPDILDAFKKLQPNKDFCKRMKMYSDSNTTYDVYKAYGLKGENVYTHFYIDDETGRLIIDSFKEI